VIGAKRRAIWQIRNGCEMREEAPACAKQEQAAEARAGGRSKSRRQKQEQAAEARAGGGI
jgi:hypothetical protein